MCDNTATTLHQQSTHGRDCEHSPVSGGHSPGHRMHGPSKTFLFTRQKVTGQDLSCLVYLAAFCSCLHVVTEVTDFQACLWRTYYLLFMDLRGLTAQGHTCPWLFVYLGLMAYLRIMDFRGSCPKPAGLAFRLRQRPSLGSLCGRI